MLIATPPHNHQIPFFKNYLRAVGARLLLWRPSVYQTVEHYFTAVYSGQDKSPITDGNLNWYLRPMGMIKMRAPALLSDPQGLAIDLGTGRGSSVQWLHRAGWAGQSIGIDLVADAAKTHDALGPRHKFINGDFSKDTVLNALPKATLVTSVNALVYIEQPLPMLELLHARTLDGGYMMLIEPVPSPYWFPRAKAYIRTPGVWRQMLEKTDWDVVEEARVSIFKYKRMPIFPLAQAYLCKRKAGA